MIWNPPANLSEKLRPVVLDKRKPYKEPKLVVYGNLRKLTEGGTMCNLEDGVLGANTHF